MRATMGPGSSPRTRPGVAALMRRPLVAALLLVAVIAPSAGSSGPETGGARLVFAATVARDETELYSIEPSGRGLAQLTFGSQASSQPVPSPDGREIAFERGASMWIMRPDGHHQRLLAVDAIEPTWTPDSRRIAYVRINNEDQSLGIRVVGLNGRGDRSLVRGEAFGPAWSPDGQSLAFDRGGALLVLHGGREHTVVSDPNIFRIDRMAWSFDGRWLAYAAAGDVDVVRADGHRRLTVSGYSTQPVWSPTSLLLGYVSAYSTESAPSVNVLSPVSGKVRALGKAAFGVNSLAWSPVGDAVAFAGSLFTTEDLMGTWELGIVTLAGQRRILRAASTYALPEGVAWTSPPPGLRYRKPVPLGPLVSADEVQLREPVDELAADGDRVAYRSCGTIAVWQPGDSKVVSVQADRPFCAEADISFYNLALADDRVAWGQLRGGNVQTNTLAVESVGNPAARAEVAYGYHTTGDRRGDERAGDLLGAGPLLVFSTWAYCDEAPRVTCPGLPYWQETTNTTQTLWRVREPSWPGECPGFPAYGQADLGRCQQLRVEPGPLRPLDVDAGRIVVSGDNATLVLDADGRQLLSIPLSTQAAQLSGSDLVVLVPGELRDYDVTTGGLLHTWPLPVVSFGGFCGVPADQCGTPQLRLEDAAHGLVAYLLDGQIHLLRPADGRDLVLHAGTAARFGSGGLFYADQAPGAFPGRVHFVPFSGLPLQ